MHFDRAPAQVVQLGFGLEMDAVETRWLFFLFTSGCDDQMARAITRFQCLFSECNHIKLVFLGFALVGPRS
jgi:hypothetical protein